MKRPSFQFYPGDWRQNANLRRCSPAARGVWVDIMCLMHDSDEYGLLRWPLKEIAQAAAASMSHVRELVDKGVLKGCEKGACEPFIYTPRSGRKEGKPVTLVGTQAGPIWYSSRMVRDEYVRTIRGEASRFSDAMGTAPKPPFGDGSTASSSSSASQNTEDFKGPHGAGGREAGGTPGEDDDSPWGDEPPPPDAPPPGAEDGAGLPEATATAYGLIAKALRQQGIQALPAHPRFRALVDAGADALEFLAFADKAKTQSDPFAYILGCVEGERRRAKAMAGALHQGRMPAAASPAASKADALMASNIAAAQRFLAKEQHGA